MSERTIDRRSELLRAAVRVFAQKGFDGARVGDIAEEAGVAHGLLYHYFRSKEDVLEEIFRRTWRNVATLAEEIEASSDGVREQLRRFASVFLGSWLTDPALDRVLILEIARTPHVGARVEEFREVFSTIARMIARGQQRGEVRADADPELAAIVFYGALEEILTGWALGRLPDSEADVPCAIETVVDVVYAGLAA